MTHKYEKILRLQEVLEVVGLGRSSIYKSIADGKFPKQVKLGPRSVGWMESEIQEWIQQRISDRNQSNSK